jgi:hypothetical protein
VTFYTTALTANADSDEQPRRPSQRVPADQSTVTNVMAITPKRAQASRGCAGCSGCPQGLPSG